jgi:hypothetical protein
LLDLPHGWQFAEEKNNTRQEKEKALMQDLHQDLLDANEQLLSCPREERGRRRGLLDQVCAAEHLIEEEIIRATEVPLSRAMRAAN